MIICDYHFAKDRSVNRASFVFHGPGQSKMAACDEHGPDLLKILRKQFHEAVVIELNPTSTN